MGKSHRIGLALGLLTIVVLLGGCVTSQPGSATPGDATAGASLWVQSACVGCHGRSAEGSRLGPALANTPLTLHEATSITRRGGPGMPEYPASQISDQDLQDMYAWWQNPVRPATAEVAQDPWTQSACIGCHGRDALGGSGPGLAGTSQPFAEFQAVVRRGARGMPAYPEAQISDQTLQAMYEWLQAQAQVPATAPGPASTGPVTEAVTGPVTEAVTGPVTEAVTGGPEQDLWIQSACTRCHGRDGRGGSGPGLVGTSQPYAGFQAVVRQGARGMPAFPQSQVSDQTLQAMYDWLQAQAEAPPPGSAPEGQPAPWVQAGCGGCHGASAEGASATALTGEDFSYEEFQRVVRRGEEGMPAYSTSQIGDADLRQMYDWIKGLP